MKSNTKVSVSTELEFRPSVELFSGNTVIVNKKGCLGISTASIILGSIICGGIYCLYKSGLKKV